MKRGSLCTANGQRCQLWLDEAAENIHWSSTTDVSVSSHAKSEYDLHGPSSCVASFSLHRPYTIAALISDTDTIAGFLVNVDVVAGCQDQDPSSETSANQKIGPFEMGGALEAFDWMLGLASIRFARTQTGGPHFELWQAARVALAELLICGVSLHEAMLLIRETLREVNRASLVNWELPLELKRSTSNEGLEAD
eukprot:CAMPEP_0185750652 /NCGR_PEP_ID=MMETSP1174-20130828/9437_1 /TAXON_ID=35687 /ORGANISM="Dictyocha speculum, Strain CCMP1381" /LENGTH=194 /DNA_ID=CAMNT_0028427287 /DNA_START=53 /DNA_END=635 /DNA_ORIENTATION=-